MRSFQFQRVTTGGRPDFLKGVFCSQEWLGYENGCVFFLRAMLPGTTWNLWQQKRNALCLVWQNWQLRTNLCFLWTYEGKKQWSISHLQGPLSRRGGTLGGIGRLAMSFRGGRKEPKFDEWIPPMKECLIGRKITITGFRQYLKDYNYTIMITLW